MSLLRKKTWWQKILHSRLMLALLIILTVMVSLAVYDRYVIEREMADRRYIKEKELTNLQSRKFDLEKKVNYLEGEQGMEHEIRRHFDVAKEGEQVVVLTGEKPTSTDTKPKPTEPEPSRKWWQIF